MSFRDFLKRHQRKQTPTGDLARDALLRDENITVDDVLSDIFMSSASHEAKIAFKKAVMKYIKENLGV